MTQNHVFAEGLEPRRLLATSVQAFIDADDRLRVIGSEGREAIQVSRPGGGDEVFVTVWSISTKPDMTWHFDDNDFSGLLMEGRGGNDALWIRRPDAVHNATLRGGNGNDFIVGAESGEDIDGGAGHDASTRWAAASTCSPAAAATTCCGPAAARTCSSAARATTPSAASPSNS